MKAIKIFYFSGTGNALQVSQWIKESVNEKGITCTLHNIADKEQIQTTNNDDLLIFIAPTHAFNYPPIMLHFIARFKKANNRIIIMNTRGGLRIGKTLVRGLSGISFMVSFLIMKLKGYKIAGYVAWDMPVSWIAFHPALKNKSLDFIIEKNKRKAQTISQKILNDKNVFTAKYDFLIDILLLPLAIAYYLAGRFFLAKSFYANDTCSKCRICKNNCPVKAIKTFGGRPFWTWKCENCMKCMNICPEKSVEAVHGIWILMFLLPSSVYGFLYLLITPYIYSTWLYILTVCIGMILVLYLLYFILSILLMCKQFAKLIAFTSLTHYKFWGRYKRLLKTKNIT